MAHIIKLFLTSDMGVSVSVLVEIVYSHLVSFSVSAQVFMRSLVSVKTEKSWFWSTS